MSEILIIPVALFSFILGACVGILFVILNSEAR